MLPPPIGRLLVPIGRVALLWPLLWLLACAPQLEQFHVTIPANPPSAETEIAQKQGTTHVCPGAQVQLAWRGKGKASLSAASGQMYQEPLCSTVHRVPAKGQELVQSNSQLHPPQEPTGTIKALSVMSGQKVAKNANELAFENSLSQMIDKHPNEVAATISRAHSLEIEPLET